MSLTLPYDQNTPAETTQLPANPPIPLPIPVELRSPELLPSGRASGKATPGMLMPETAVNKDNLAA